MRTAQECWATPCAAILKGWANQGLSKDLICFVCPHFLHLLWVSHIFSMFRTLFLLVAFWGCWWSFSRSPYFANPQACWAGSESLLKFELLTSVFVPYHTDLYLMPRFIVNFWSHTTIGVTYHLRWTWQTVSYRQSLAQDPEYIAYRHSYSAGSAPQRPCPNSLD